MAAVPVTKRVVRAASTNFASDEHRERFESALRAAQDANLEGRTADAEARCLDALRIKAHPLVFNLLETMAEQTGDFARAREFRLLNAYVAQDPVLWQQLYADYLQSGDLFRAAVCLKRLGALTKDDGEKRQIALDRSDLLLSVGEWKQAATAYEDLWSRSEFQDTEVLAKIAELYFQQGRFTVLSRLIRRAKEHHDSFTSEVRSQRAKVYQILTNIEAEVFIERGMYEAAVTSINEAAKVLLLGTNIKVLNADLIARLAIAYALAGNQGQAVEFLSAAAEPAALQHCGDSVFDACRAFMSVGFFRDAVGVIERLLEVDELRIAAVWHAAGECYNSLGRLTEADRAFQRVLQIEPDHARTRIALAKMALEIGDTTRCEEFLAPRGADTAIDRVLISIARTEVLAALGSFTECIEVALPVIQILDCTVDDEESIVTGGSRRRNATAVLPSVVRSSSAIVPSTTLHAAAVGAPAQEANFSVSASIAASFAVFSTARTTLSAVKQGTVAATSVSGSAADGQDAAASDGIFRFKKSRKRAEKRAPPRAGPAQPSAENVRDVGNLDDLEGLEDMDVGDPTAADADELPSLDDVARSLDDPEMASLFLRVTSGGRDGNRSEADDSLTLLNSRPIEGAGRMEGMQHDFTARMKQLAERVTAHDLMRIIGIRGLMALVNRTLESYEKLGQLVEAKDLAQYVRVRLSKAINKRARDNAAAQRTLARAHIRLSVLAGDTKQAVANAVACLKDFIDKRSDDDEVLRVWDLVNQVVNAGDTSKILQRLQHCGSARSSDVMIAIVAGNMSYNHRQFGDAARCYWSALSSLPDDALLNLLLACCFAFVLNRKGNDGKLRHRCSELSAGFLERYVAASRSTAANDPLVGLEVQYNVGRLAYFIGSYHIAMARFEAVSTAKLQHLELAPQRQCWLDTMQRAASHAIVCMIRHGGSKHESGPSMDCANAILESRGHIRV